MKTIELQSKGKPHTISVNEPKSWSERHHYETDDDDDPLSPARGIFTAIGWCIGYGALLIFIAWVGKQVWGMLS